jgi:hypothetical protein
MTAPHLQPMQHCRPQQHLTYKVKPGREGSAEHSALGGCGGSGGGASDGGAASRCTISLNRPGRPSALDHQDCQAAVRLYPVRNVCRQIAGCQSRTALCSPLLE